MPINSYTVGRDLTLTIVADGEPVSFDQIVGFQAKQEKIVQKIKGLDGVTRNVSFPDGWSGRFSLERQDRTLDDFFNQEEADYYEGVDRGEITITETVTENDGSVAQYRYRGVQLMLDDAGEFKGDSSVKQTMNFTATRRVTIA